MKNDGIIHRLLYNIYTNKTDNKLSKNKWGNNLSSYGTFSYLACDTRDIVLPWKNTLGIDHYPVA